MSKREQLPVLQTRDAGSGKKQVNRGQSWTDDILATPAECNCRYGVHGSYCDGSCTLAPPPPVEGA